MDRQDFLELIDGSRSKRSLQKDVGPSEIGGCERRLWYRLKGTPPCNETLQMAAFMGTAIHEKLERSMKARDPFESRYLTELSVEYDGLTGHVDVYDKEQRRVIDYKSNTKRKLAEFPDASQVAQVQVYGYLLSQNGYAVDTVSLVGIPRDGNELHVKIHVEPYDEGVALEALGVLRRVGAMVDPPEPEEPARFCRDYCSYFDSTGEQGCPSKSGRPDA